MGQRKKTNYKIIIFQTSNKIFFLFLHSWLLFFPAQVWLIDFEYFSIQAHVEDLYDWKMKLECTVDQKCIWNMHYKRKYASAEEFGKICQVGWVARYLNVAIDICILFMISKKICLSHSLCVICDNTS